MNNFFKVFSDYPRILRYHKRYGNKRGTVSVVMCFYGVWAIILGAVTAIMATGIPVSIEENIHLEGFIAFLASPWFGLLDTLMIIFMGAPLVAWGLASLVGILVGVDINAK